MSSYNHEEQSAFDESRYEALSFINYLMLLIVFLNIFFFMFYLQSLFGAILNFSLAFFMSINILFLKKQRKSFDTYSHISLFLGYITFYILNLHLGAINSPYLIWGVVFVIYTLFFTNKKSFFLWLLAIVLHPFLLKFTVTYWPEIAHLTKTMPSMQSTNAFSYETLILIFSASLITLAQIAEKRFIEIYHSKVTMSELVRILSYDITLPTNNIKKHANELLTNDTLSKNNITYIHKIFQATDALTSILKRVQELKDIGNNDQKIKIEPFELFETLEKAIPLYTTTAEKKGIKFKITKVQDAIFVLGAKDLLAYQVIPNILTNAIKFSPKDSSIEISINKNTLTIKDFGIGIPNQILSCLFRYDKNTTRLGTNGEKGTGFGMPLVKSLLEKMGATLEVRTHPIESYPDDHWTEFMMTFKCKEMTDFNSQDNISKF